ncbi:hypothetical protein [Sphingomonas sp. Leaf343]|uniref:hypothetical protein n=1 Tax=Sphingomonas sp. Leaf343 TaxID=1736345 RepID=UPI0012E2F651|nr:hypothetical protein [Sphingomonas sp. Leaf343]
MVRLPRPDLTGRRLSTGRLSTGMIPTIGAGATAVLTAIFFLILPDWRLEAAVDASGLAQLLPLAKPPLGLTARALILLGGTALAGAVSWSSLYLIWGPGGFLAPTPVRFGGTRDVPVARRADTHPDAPTRRPLSADELGTPPSPPTPPAAPPPTPPSTPRIAPPPPPPVEQPIPADLEQPLAAFHPGAILDEPLEPVRPVASIARSAGEPAAEEERIETFVLPMPEITVAPTSGFGERASTLDSLIARLEQGVGRRAQLARR